MINTVSARDIIEWVSIAFVAGLLIGVFATLWLGNKYGWK